MRDLTILGQTAIVIIGGVCIAVALGLYCWLTRSDNSLDEDTDGDRLVDHCGWVDCPEAFGRVPQAAPGSREPSQQVVSAASGFDPIARGNGRAFHERN